MFLSQWLTECLCQVSDLNNRIWIFLRWHKKAPLISYKHFLPFRCKHYLINCPTWNKVLTKCTDRVDQLSSLHNSRQPPATGRSDTEMENSIYHPPLQTHLFFYKHGTKCLRFTVFPADHVLSSKSNPFLSVTNLSAQSETCPIPKCILGCNLTSCKGTKTIRDRLRLSVGRRIGKRLCLCPFPHADIP